MANRNQPADGKPPDADDGIASQLDRLARIMAMTAIRSENQQEQIKFLHSVGYTPLEIAQMLKTSSNAISVTISRLKHQKKR